jgi:hypothetical protein
MQYGTGQLLSLVALGFAMLMLVLSLQMFRLNRKKGTVSLILTLVYAFLSGYYLYLFLFTSVPKTLFEKELEKIKRESNVAAERFVPPVEKFPEPGKDNSFLVSLQVGEKVFDVAEGDEVEVKKTSRLKITGVKTEKNMEGLKADFKGFAGNPRLNDRQDIGYWITFDRVLKHWKVDEKKEKYEVHILRDNEKIGEIYITFVD